MDQQQWRAIEGRLITLKDHIQVEELVHFLLEIADESAVTDLQQFSDQVKPPSYSSPGSLVR